MTAIDSTTKLINKASKIVTPKNLCEHLIKNIQTNYTPLSHREFGFLISYYGLNGEQKNLETIGNTQSKVLTRERVRQIKEKAIKRLKHNSRSKILKSYLGK